MAERLQKILARAGIAARRKAEELMLAGRVRVDGRVITELGTKADGRRQRIEVDGQRVIAEPLVYVLMHKPRGVVCTANDPEGRPTITSLVHGLKVRVVPIGRLDYATSGVLLLSNDGDFAMGLLHPQRKVEKTYVAKVHGSLSESDVARFSESIVIDGKPTRPIKARLLRIENGKTWLELGLEEGKNRQIRRIGEALGYPVLRLVRTHFAGLTVEDLRPGEFRMLTVSELRNLQKAYGVPRRARPAAIEIERGKLGDDTSRARRRAASKFGVRPRPATAEPSQADRIQERSRNLPRVAPGHSPSRWERSAHGGDALPTDAFSAKGSRKFSGNDPSRRKKPAARTLASKPRTGSPAAASTVWSNTTKSGKSPGKAKTRHNPSGPFAETIPNKRSRRFGSG